MFAVETEGFLGVRFSFEVGMRTGRTISVRCVGPLVVFFDNDQSCLVVE